MLQRWRRYATDRPAIGIECRSGWVLSGRNRGGLEELSDREVKISLAYRYRVVTYAAIKSQHP